jgi:hypothetical protein
LSQKWVEDDFFWVKNKGHCIWPQQWPDDALFVDVDDVSFFFLMHGANDSLSTPLNLKKI